MLVVPLWCAVFINFIVLFICLCNLCISCIKLKVSMCVIRACALLALNPVSRINAFVGVFRHLNVWILRVPVHKRFTHCGVPRTQKKLSPPSPSQGYQKFHLSKPVGQNIVLHAVPADTVTGFLCLPKSFHFILPRLLQSLTLECVINSESELCTHVYLTQLFIYFLISQFAS